MNALERTLFEDPLYLYVALGISEIVLVVMWHSRRQPKLKLAMLVPVALAGLAFALERLVVTDREQIIGISRGIARDIEAGSLDRLADCLDEGFAGIYGNRESALARGRSLLDQYRPKAITLRGMRVTLEDGQATMSVATHVELGGSEMSGTIVPIQWTIEWAKVGEGDAGVWRITSARAENWPAP